MFAATVMFMDENNKNREYVVFGESVKELQSRIEVSESIAKSRGWIKLGSYIETVDEYLEFDNSEKSESN